jgi:hypothetical protein
MGSRRRELVYGSGAGELRGESGVFGDVERFGEGDADDDDDDDDMVQAGVIVLDFGPLWIQ